MDQGLFEVVGEQESGKSRKIKGKQVKRSLIYFVCESYGGSDWIVRAMDKDEMVTAAAGSDPWDAAARCVWYMRNRLSKQCD